MRHLPAIRPGATGLALAIGLVVAGSAQGTGLGPLTRVYVSYDAPVIAIEHVRVIDGTGAPARDDQAVLQPTDTPGIEFCDYPQLQGFEPPEWSHLSESAARQFTATLVPLVQGAFSRPLPQTPPPRVP